MAVMLPLAFGTPQDDHPLTPTPSIDAPQTDARNPWWQLHLCCFHRRCGYASSEPLHARLADGELPAGGSKSQRTPLLSSEPGDSQYAEYGGMGAVDAEVPAPLRSSNISDGGWASTGEWW